MSKKGAVKQPQRSVSFEEKLIGTADEEYNLISILYHALQGAETLVHDLQDAAAAGDQERVQFLPSGVLLAAPCLGAGLVGVAPWCACGLPMQVWSWAYASLALRLDRLCTSQVNDMTPSPQGVLL